MKSTRLFVSVLLALVVLITVPAQADIPQYTFTPLGTLGGTASKANDINDSGMVVGYSSDSQGSSHAYIWLDGVMQDLGTFGAPYSRAIGINDSGQVVGSYGSSIFLWQDGVKQDLGYGVARGINNSGQVVGQSNSDMYGHSYALLWQNGTMQNIGNLGAYGRTGDINDSGEVVFSSHIIEPPYNTQSIHAYLWQNGVKQDLGSLGTNWTYANGINNSSQVVGQSSNAQGRTRAFLWQEGLMQDISAVDVYRSSAHAINNFGQIVGSYSNYAGGNTHAFVWTEDAGMVDLNYRLTVAAQGWTLCEALAINDNGWIVGWGITPTGSEQAFLLKPAPVPEPSGISALLGGLASISLLRRRKA